MFTLPLTSDQVCVRLIVLSAQCFFCVGAFWLQLYFLPGMKCCVHAPLADHREKSPAASAGVGKLFDWWDTVGWKMCQRGSEEQQMDGVFW